MTDVLESAPRQSNPPASDKLAGRVAFVTGGTRGIGAAIAHSLANQGATVAVGYNRDDDSAERFVADLLTKTRPHGASASAHRGNVGAPGDCRRTIGEVIDSHGRLDILVNNAGITMDKTVAAMTEDDWHSVLAVNLSGAFSARPRSPTWSSVAAGASSTCRPSSERRATSAKPTMLPRSRVCSA